MSQDKPAHPFLPMVPPARYASNFLQQVVCELRFPTLFELDTAKPPEAFARALRKAYPHHGHMIQEVNINGGEVSRAHVHVFKSKALDWTITLRSSALTIETTRYESFEKLIERIQVLLDESGKIIDSDFFTRVGLRYINTIPFDGTKLDSLRGWIRDDFVGVLINEDLGLVHEFSSRISGSAEFGGYLLQHGVSTNPATNRPEYLLDFDFWRENVEIVDILDTLKVLHDHEFSMFSWAIGDAARDHLGPSIYKGDA